MGKVIIRGAKAREKALSILRDGGSFQDAAEATGYGMDYIRQLGAKEGIRKQKRKYDYDEIKNLYTSGKTPKEIADIIGAKSIATVYKLLHDTYGSVCKHKSSEVTAYVMRFCKRCNAAFLVHPNHNQVFCSLKCQTADSHERSAIKRRIAVNSSYVDKDITLKKLAKRDKDICWICGEAVDWADYDIGQNGRRATHKKYPSIDHVIALANGGDHSWQNVRLAHVGCNAKKGVKIIG